MLDFLKGWIARRRWERSDIGIMLKMHTQRFFVGDGPLAYLPQPQKLRIATRFYDQVAAIGKSTNGFLDLRQALGEAVLHYARFQVLALKEDEKGDMPYGGNASISGALHHHIREASAHDEYLGRLVFEDPSLTDEDLIGYANRECVIALYQANGFNLIRIDSEGKSERDWYKPFVEAMLVYEEDNVRTMIGLAAVLPEAQDAVSYSYFFNAVVSGEPNPLFSWSRTYPDHELVSPTS